MEEIQEIRATSSGKVHSKVIKVNKDKSAKSLNKLQPVVFEENGELVSMEIDDGGVATAEFASEEEMDQIDPNNETESESDSSDSDPESEDGEITMQSDNDSLNRDELHDSQESDKSFPDKNKRIKLQSPPDTKEKKCKKRPSVEDRLDTLSDTLFGLKEMFMKRSLVEEQQLDELSASGKKWKKSVNSAGKAQPEGTSLNSETTIYHNALNQISQEDCVQVPVDQEIGFKQPQSKYDSSSFEDRIDTSDEFMEIGEEMDGNEQINLNCWFIADCEEEARCRRRSLSMLKKKLERPRLQKLGY